MKFRSLLFAGAAAGALAIAPAAQATTTDTASTVTGTAGTELSLTIAAPAAMTFTPSTDGTASSLVTVTSTAPTWTLSVFEAGTVNNTDPLNPVNVAGDGKMATALGAALNNPLDWKLSTSSTWTPLTGVAATVGTGALVDTRTVDYRQQIDATEDITSNAAYSSVLTYRVVG